MCFRLMGCRVGTRKLLLCLVRSDDGDQMTEQSCEKIGYVFHQTQVVMPKCMAFWINADYLFTHRQNLCTSMPTAYNLSHSTTNLQVDVTNIDANMLILTWHRIPNNSYLNNIVIYSLSYYRICHKHNRMHLFPMRPTIQNPPTILNSFMIFC